MPIARRTRPEIDKARLPLAKPSAGPMRTQEEIETQEVENGDGRKGGRR
jgi:hypothetical protein